METDGATAPALPTEPVEPFFFSGRKEKALPQTRKGLRGPRRKAPCGQRKKKRRKVLEAERKRKRKERADDA